MAVSGKESVKSNERTPITEPKEEAILYYSRTINKGDTTSNTKSDRAGYRSVSC